MVWTNVEFKPIGYKILLEMLVMGKFQNVVEVPFIFEDRSSGRSKMKARQQIDYLKHIFSLMRRKGEVIRFLKFIGVGLSGVLVNVGHSLARNRVRRITYITSHHSLVLRFPLSTNFLLNDYFTFADRRTGKTKSFVSRRLVKYQPG